jgi:hypothetical protein
MADSYREAAYWVTSMKIDKSFMVGLLQVRFFDFCMTDC